MKGADAARFLRVELASSPRRWQATFRLVIACVVGVALVQALQIPHGAWVLVSIVALAQSDVGSSLRKTAHRIAATLCGMAVAISTLAAFPQEPWARIPLMVFWLGLSLFLSRTITAPYLGLLGGITVGMFTSDLGSDPVEQVNSGLWRAATVMLGVLISAATQWLLWRTEPWDLLRTDLLRSVGTVQALLKEISDPRGGRSPPHVRVGNLTHHVEWVSNSEVGRPSERRHRSARLHLILGVQRIATAAASLEELIREDPDLPALPEALRGRVHHLQDALCQLESVINAPATSTYVFNMGSNPRTQSDAESARWLSGVVEIEQALLDVSRILPALKNHAAPLDTPASVLESEEKRHFFTPRFTWRNIEDLLLSAKGAGAALLAYAIVSALDWPGAFTAIITCIVVAQGSRGASVQKSLLRLSGALIGLVVSLLTIILVFPSLNSLAPYLVTVGLVMTPLAYMTSGGPRISYVGFQAAFVFVLAVLSSFSPSVDLAVPAGRSVGILLGILCYAAVDLAFPQYASEQFPGAIAGALRHMAEFAKLGVPAWNIQRPSGGFRLLISGELSRALQLYSDSGFEIRQERSQRERVAPVYLSVLEQASSLNLLLTALARNRINLRFSRIPTEVRHPFRKVIEDISHELESAADVLQGKTGSHPWPDIAPVLRRADSALHTFRRHGDSALVTELSSQLELYRRVARRLGILRQAVDTMTEASTSRARAERSNA